VILTLACGSSNSATKIIDGPTQTVIANPSSSPIATETIDPEVTALPDSTNAPQPTNTPAGVSESLPSGAITQGANLRAGPGTNYDIVGGLAAGDQVNIIGQTADSEWYQIELASGTTAWIASFLVSTEATAIPTVRPDAIPSTPAPIPATNTPAATNTAVATNTPVPAVADVRITRVYNSGKVEYVEITNKGTAAQDIGGWSVSGSKGDERYTFPGGYVLGPGETVKLHSGENGIDAYPTDIYWTQKTVWNNSGETCYLWNAQGEQVTHYTWG